MRRDTRRTVVLCDVSARGGLPVCGGAFRVQLLSYHPIRRGFRFQVRTEGTFL